MAGYIQRLLDTAPPMASALQPRQRPGSPLVAADQRLSDPRFAENFAFGGPPEVSLDGEPQLPRTTLPEAADGLRRSTPSETQRQGAQEPRGKMSPSPAFSQSQPKSSNADQGPVREILRETERIASNKPGTDTTSRAQLRREGYEADTPAVNSPADKAARTTPKSRSVLPPASPKLPEPSIVSNRDTVTAPNRVDQTGPASDKAGTSDTPAPTFSPSRPETKKREAKPTAPTMERTSGDADTQTRPAPMKPLRPAEPTALPLQIPPQPDWSRIEQRIAELVSRAAASIGTKAAAAPATRTRDGGNEKPRSSPISSSAASASVIGKIGPSARHTTLFGSRLR